MENTKIVENTSEIPENNDNNSKKIDEVVQFDTKKFELEKELKKISLSKYEYKKWLKKQESAQNTKSEHQKQKAKKIIIIVGVALFFLIIITTFVVVSVTR